LWATAFLAGLRRGELMALDHEDVGTERLRVRRSWDMAEGFVGTKSDAGVRTVPAAVRPPARPPTARPSRGARVRAKRNSAVRAGQRPGAAARGRAPPMLCRRAPQEGQSAPTSSDTIRSAGRPDRASALSSGDAPQRCGGRSPVAGTEARSSNGSGTTWSRSSCRVTWLPWRRPGITRPPDNLSSCGLSLARWRYSARCW
jgi:hypothetical protein